ncbi:hypothetical protein J2Z69_000514 [Paenibacillus shirakamiensis]|uniref:Cyclic lactone autoinducer peptide n=1 Tax=Paenibacillus shirakamiensis TaxID=1265935 RepID=A0ABS4JEI8_9BACL|nr:cyclic lactone autoinducer peptide [Paenibacillus shirakamiensis]MBP1999495.1 hypothetical protein [Paenibacillus shirakamiensis]
MMRSFVFKAATWLSALAILTVKPASVLYLYSGETPDELLV